MARAAFSWRTTHRRTTAPPQRRHGVAWRGEQLAGINKAPAPYFISSVPRAATIVCAPYFVAQRALPLDIVVTALLYIVLRTQASRCGARHERARRSAALTVCCCAMACVWRGARRCRLIGVVANCTLKWRTAVAAWHHGGRRGITPGVLCGVAPSATSLMATAAAKLVVPILRLRRVAWRQHAYKPQTACNMRTTARAPHSVTRNPPLGAASC